MSKTENITLTENIGLKGEVKISIRYSFAGQFLMGAALFATKAREIEDAEDETTINDDLRMEHHAYVVSAFMQSVAALESEISEIFMYGPAHHLGSGHGVEEDNDFLKGIEENLEANSTLDKYSAVLHLLRKPAIKESNFYRNVKLVTQVRNELIHYKSKFGEQMDELKLFRSLKSLNFAPPKFSSLHKNFFPHQFLSASSASWAVESVCDFLDGYFNLLGIVSPITNYRKRIKVPSIIKI